MAPPVDAAAPAATVDAGAPQPLALAWHVLDATTDQNALQACLDQLPVEARAAGAQGALMVVSRGLASPQTVSVEPARVRVRTPVSGDPQRAALLHIATISCLKAPQATVLDPALERRFTAADWPAPSARGGLPVEAVVAFEHDEGRWVTRGLSRLGLAELGLAGADEPHLRRGIQRAAAAWIVANDPGARQLAVGGQTLRLRASAPWWSGEALALAKEDGEPWVPPAPAARPKPPPEPAADVAPRPKPPTRPRPPRPKPTTPAFRPEYR